MGISSWVLSQFAVETLVRHLAARDAAEIEALVDTKTGRVPGFVYKLLTNWTPMPFVDAFGVARINGKLMAGLIGGKNGQDQTFEQSLLYQWKADLGLNVNIVRGTTWRHPLDTFQYMRRSAKGPYPDGIGHDRGKNSRSHVYAVEIVGGPNAKVTLGEKIHDVGAEAATLTWVDPSDPKYQDPDLWANYPGMAGSFHHAWSKLLSGINSGQYQVE